MSATQARTRRQKKSLLTVLQRTLFSKPQTVPLDLSMKRNLSLERIPTWNNMMGIYLFIYLFDEYMLWLFVSFVSARQF